MRRVSSGVVAIPPDRFRAVRRAREVFVGRVLCLDVGTKTIGVAVSDAIGMLAHPVCTVSRRGVRKDVEVLRGLVAERLAEVLGQSFERVAEATTANARELFGLV